MAEMETLAVVMCESCSSPHANRNRGPHLARVWGPCEAHQEATDAALSWLASVLADAATVEVVARSHFIATASDHGEVSGPLTPEDHWDALTDSFRSMLTRRAEASLAALSAHLTAPARAGDTSGEEGLWVSRSSTASLCG